MTCVTRVCVEALDVSGRHLFWAEEPSAALLASIRDVGQLEPILARFAQDKWRVVSGYKRVRALAETGAGVLVMEPANAPDPIADGLLYLHANAHRPLDDVMRLRALRYFEKYMDKQALSARIAPLLGTQPRSGAWQRLCTWLELPADWDDLFGAGHLPLAAGPLLTKLETRDLDALEPYFRDLKWSRSLAVQWLTFLMETSRREAVAPAALLADCGMPEILAAKLSPQDKLQRMFARARALRYPALAGLEQRFYALRKELTGSSRWELIPSEGFEHDVVELRLRARGAAQVRQAAQDLERMAASQRMPELFEVFR